MVLFIKITKLIMKTFTIDQIHRFLESQDSFGDVMYNLSEEKIEKANKTISMTLQEVMDSGNWTAFCDKYGVSEYAVNEGGGDVSYDIYLSDAKKWNLI
jgi:S-adenosylmethionine hydrolase